ncbi:MAG: NAD(P)H-dependent oxidoreductase [Anaerolineae bacterium]|nr:NAD(P)H-dependent oxidoreductase [Anaerolineae bacterium]
MKAIALVVSARERGNCYDFAEFMLERLKQQGVEGELINFYDHQITPCQRCSYECVARFDPQRGVDQTCPIEDDVRMIWEKCWQADILLLFVPNYGGVPPALWIAFSQRHQALSRQEPVEKLKRSVVSAVVLAAPHWSTGAQWTPSLMSDEVKCMGRKVAGFEVINNAGFKTENLFGGLINEEEIQRRLLFLADRTLEVAREIAELR